LNRQRALHLLGAGSAAAAAAPFAFATRVDAQAAPTVVRVGTFASEATGSVFYAQDQGFLTKHGLSAQINVTTGGAAAAAAIIGGDLDIGEGDIITIAIAHDRGVPFTFIAPGELHTLKVPTLAVVVADPNVKLGKDFNGKTMACNVSRGFGSLITNDWIDNNGGDSKTVKWVELPFPTLTAALQRGTIDGFCAPEPFITSAINGGGHLVLMDVKPVTPTMLQGGWFATKEWVAKNPASAAGFAAAMRDANTWGNSNPAGTAEIISKYSRIPLAVITGMKMRGQYQVKFDPSTMQPLIDAAAKYGYISKAFPAADLISNV
jgi:NitT/TauT family transport system substrate-binding protein